MTVTDVAKILKVSKSTVRRAIQSERLEVYRIGAQPQIRISQEQLDRYVGGNKAYEKTNGAAIELAVNEDPPSYSTDETRSESSTQPTVIDGRTGRGVSWKVIHDDVISALGRIDENSVNCIVTSPPYYWQRDYEVAGQIGHEPDIDGYVDNLKRVFHEAKRVLREDGVLFLNIGDTYYSAKGKPHGHDSKHRARQLSRKKLRAVDGPGLGVPRKSLIGIPWRVALALQEDGWVLRSAIAWQRPAPMPEPTAHDRPWRTFEPVFLFSKNPRYWFNRDALNGEEDVWRISAHSYNPGSHFAPFPVAFADRCISAGCPDGGTVLDPFVGSGTTMVAALNRGMSTVGIDLKREYCDFVVQRIDEEHGATLFDTTDLEQSTEGARG